MNDYREKEEWPRTVAIKPQLSEVMRQELDEDYDSDEDSGFALAFLQGVMIENIQINAWNELRLPAGYEFAHAQDRIDYNCYLEKMRPKKRRG